MTRLEQASRAGTPYYNIMDHRKDISSKWMEMDEFLRFGGTLDSDLKEEVRRTVAQQSGCKFCASLGEPQPHYDDARVAAAVRFGTSVAQSPTGVSDAVFDDLREHFNAAEIVELSCWIAFMYGAEMFGSLMNLDPATVFGTKGWIDIRDRAHVEAPDGWVVTRGQVGQPIETSEAPRAEPVLTNLEAFANAVRGGSYPITGEDLVNNIALLEAIIQGAKSGNVEKVM